MRHLRTLLIAAAAGATLAVPRASALGQRPDSAVFRGRVLRATDLAPIPGAHVLLPALNLDTTTDSTGTFRFTLLPVGTQIAQVRKLGYTMRQDTITLTVGFESVRTYALEAKTPVLDTVRASARKQEQRQYISPLLQAFVKREQAHAGGYFISDSTFRKNENATLANLVVSHMPGVSWSYMGAKRVLVSTRKSCRGLALLHPCSTKQDCFVAIYVDGVLYYNAKMAENGVLPPDMEKQFNVGTLAGAEYYPGGASMPIDMHPDDDGCGSLWLWTRER